MTTHHKSSHSARPAHHPHGHTQTLEEKRHNVRQNAPKQQSLGTTIQTSGVGTFNSPDCFLFGYAFTEQPKVHYGAEVVGFDPSSDTAPVSQGYVHEWFINTDGHYEGAYVGARVLDGPTNATITHHFHFNATAMKGVVHAPAAVDTSAPTVVNPADGNDTLAQAAQGGEIGDGQPPSGSPTATVVGGIGSLILDWSAIANSSLVSYDVHVSTTSGFTPSAGDLAFNTTGTGGVVTTLPGGGALVPGTTYYVVIVAWDKDGTAAPGAQSSGTPRQSVSADLAAAAVQTNNIATGAITQPLVYAGTNQSLLINATNLAANSVTANQIAAGAVTAQALTIGTYGENAIPNGGFEDPVVNGNGPVPSWTAGGDSTGPACTYGLSSTAQSGAQSATIQTPGSSSGGAIISKAIPVTAGDIWFFATQVQASAAQSGGLYFRIGFATSATATRSGWTAYTDIVANAPFTTSWQQVSGQVAVPSGATYMFVSLYAWTSSAGYTAYFDSVLAKRVITGVQIAGRTISAGNIAAGAITANEIAANTITAGQIAANTITAGQIQANTIGTGQLTATAINGMTIVGATIQTAGSGQSVQLGPNGTYGNAILMTDSSGNAMAITPANSSGHPVMNFNLAANNPNISLALGTSYSQLISPTDGTSVSLLVGSGQSTFNGVLKVGVGVGSTLASLYLNSWPGLGTTGLSALMVRGSDGAVGVTTSSERYKTNIVPIAQKVAPLLELEPVEFDFIPTGERSIGFIAEQAERLGLLDYVRYDLEDPTKVEGFHYDRWVVALQQICRQQDEQIKNLTARLDALEQKDNS